MARLIVEESGTRRAFKVGDGVLTIGTGADARLRVSAPDVAEIHAEIQVQGGKAVVRARPGVVPPTVGGEGVLGEAPVAYGEEIKVGSVRLWLEDESLPAGAGAPASTTSAPAPATPAAAPVSATPPAARQAAAGATSPAERAVRREQAIAQAKKRGDRSVVQRTRPRVQKGLPGGVIVGIILAVVVVGFFAGKKMIEDQVSGPPPTAATLNEVENLIRLGSFKDARARLDKLSDATGADALRRDALYDELEEKAEVADLAIHNSLGTTYLDTKLKKYESLYLQGLPSKPKAREFLLRCRYFKERWPEHHEIDWVRRKEKRFEDVVSLADPPTLEDVAWQVECLTKTNPKFFGDAFDALDAFLDGASGADLEAANELRAELVEARKVEYEDRILQAKYLLEQKDKPVESFAELVVIVTRFGDEEMTNTAASMLLQFDNVQGKLKGWRENRTLEYEQLAAHPMIRAYLAKNPLDG